MVSPRDTAGASHESAGGDSVRMAAAVLDASGVVIGWSPAAQQLLGYSAAEVLGPARFGIACGRCGARRRSGLHERFPRLPADERDVLEHALNLDDRSTWSRACSVAATSSSSAASCTARPGPGADDPAGLRRRPRDHRDERHRPGRTGSGQLVARAAPLTTSTSWAGFPVHRAPAGTSSPFIRKASASSSA